MTCSLRIVTSAGLIACATPGFAHHPGSIGNTGGSGPINTISASTIPAGISIASVVYDRLGIDRLSDATLSSAAVNAASAGDDHAHVHSLDSIAQPSLNYAYGVTSDLTLSVRLPYVLRSDIREGHAHEHEGEFEGEVQFRGDTDSIGDVTALAQWRLLNNRGLGLEAAILLGLKAPTGSTDESDLEGERFDAEFQPGSGSWDGLLGLALTRRAGPWSFDASLLYTLAGTGTHDTDLGDRAHFGVAASYRLTSFTADAQMFNGGRPHDHEHGAGPHSDVHVETSGPALDLILELNGEWQDKQEQGGQIDRNSGGSTIYISPGLRLSQDKWSAFASVGIPVINDLNGVQAEPDWRFSTGVSLAF